MWSDEARAAAAEARKKGHASQGNRQVAKHVKKQHDNHEKSVLGGVAKGALIGTIVPGVGTVAGALIGGGMRIAHNRAVRKGN
jgi:hypothetical protein